MAGGERSAGDEPSAASSPPSRDSATAAGGCPAAPSAAAQRPARRCLPPTALTGPARRGGTTWRRAGSSATGTASRPGEAPGEAAEGLGLRAQQHLVLSKPALWFLQLKIGSRNLRTFISEVSG